MSFELRNNILVWNNKAYIILEKHQHQNGEIYKVLYNNEIKLFFNLPNDHIQSFLEERCGDLELVMISQLNQEFLEILRNHKLASVRIMVSRYYDERKLFQMINDPNRFVRYNVAKRIYIPDIIPLLEDKLEMIRKIAQERYSMYKKAL